MRGTTNNKAIACAKFPDKKSFAFHPDCILRSFSQFPPPTFPQICAETIATHNLRHLRHPASQPAHLAIAPFMSDNFSRGKRVSAPLTGCQEMSLEFDETPNLISGPLDKIYLSRAWRKYKFRNTSLLKETYSTFVAIL